MRSGDVGPTYYSGEAGEVPLVQEPTLVPCAVPNAWSGMLVSMTTIIELSGLAGREFFRN